jgi:hypothetical protein
MISRSEYPSARGWTTAHPLFFLGFALLLLPSVTNCGGDTVSPEGNTLSPGTFRAEVTGAIQTTLEGVAGFGVSEDGSSFALTLAALGPDGIAMYRLQGGQPGPGQYMVHDNATVAFTGSEDFWGSMMLVGAGAIFMSESGTITISESSANALAGSTEFTAVDDEVGRVTITASFRAQR